MLSLTFSVISENLPDIIGCLGTLIILSAYVLLQTRRLGSGNTLFSFLNFVGALMILVSLFYSWNLAAIVMESSWAAVSGFGLFKGFFPPKHPQNELT